MTGLCWMPRRPRGAATLFGKASEPSIPDRPSGNNKGRKGFEQNWSCSGFLYFIVSSPLGVMLEEEM